jgi:hypothetical protein
MMKIAEIRITEALWPEDRAVTRAFPTVRRAGLASISTPGQQASTRRHRGALDKSESG